MKKLLKNCSILWLSASLLCFDHISHASHQTSTLLSEDSDQNPTSFGNFKKFDVLLSQDEQNFLKRFLIGAMLESKKKDPSLAQKTSNFFTLLNESFANYKKDIKVKNMNMFQIY